MMVVASARISAAHQTKIPVRAADIGDGSIDDAGSFRRLLRPVFQRLIRHSNE
jgi:hypothetical protein